jgi:uncharacterized membrane protein YfcA
MDATAFSLVIGIVAFAALVRSTFGFGDAMTAMPLLALVIPLRTATPLMGFVGPTLSVLLLIREWRHLELRSALRLILATLAGLPFGLFLLKRVDERAVNAVLAAVIILFALYNLFRPGLMRLRSERPAWAFGFAAGVLGAAYNTNGPPVILYGVLRGWKPETFRATLQGYFLPTGTAILIGQGIAGLWTAAVLKSYLIALPLILLAVLAGTALSRKIRPERFTTAVHVLMLAAGTVLLIKSIV